MRMKNNDTKIPQLPLSVWLSYLLVCTLLLTGVTFSRYATTATGGDSARVAKFDVKIAGSKDALSIDGSNSTADLTDSYTLTVTNNSEVAVEYSVAVVTEKPLPAGIKLEVGSETDVTDGKETKFIFTGGTLAPDENGTHELTVTALLETLTVNVEQDVTVSVTAKQID